MTDAVLVINAGSSSIKFASYAAGDEEPKLIAKGQIEGIGSGPRFVVEDPEERVLDEKSWPDGAALPHEVEGRSALKQLHWRSCCRSIDAEPEDGARR